MTAAPEVGPEVTLALCDLEARELSLVAALLRPGAMRRRLTAVVGAAGRVPCAVLDAKYQPGRNVTVLYQVGDRLVTAEHDLSPEDREDREDREDLRLWVYPDDPALPGLAVLTDPDALAAALEPIVPGVGRLRVRSATLLRYRAHRRATLHVAVRRAGGRPERFIVKAFHDRAKGAAAHDEAVQLAGLDWPRPGAPRLATPVAFLPEPRLLVQRPVTGQPLDALLVAGDRRGRTGLRAAAVALSALHARAPVGGRVRPVGAELQRFLVRADALARVHPPLGRRLASLAEQLIDTAPVPGELSIVHGDCKPSQFLVGGTVDGYGVALLDFDSAGLADPAADVGTFLATLRQLAVAGRPGRPAGCDLETEFLSAYRQAAGAAAGVPRRARWHQAVALQRKAFRAFGRTARSGLPAALADEALRCLRDLERLPEYLSEKRAEDLPGTPPTVCPSVPTGPTRTPHDE